MVLVLILFGLIFGRWWRLALVAAAVGWPALLVATGVASAGIGLFGVAIVAMVNTGIGIVIYQLLAWTARFLRRG